MQEMQEEMQEEEMQEEMQETNAGKYTFSDDDCSYPKSYDEKQKNPL